MTIQYLWCLRVYQFERTVVFVQHFPQCLAAQLAQLLNRFCIVFGIVRRIVVRRYEVLQGLHDVYLRRAFRWNRQQNRGRHSGSRTAQKRSQMICNGRTRMVFRRIKICNSSGTHAHCGKRFPIDSPNGAKI